MNPTLPIPDLPAALTSLLRQIPPSRVTTYGDLAEALGDLKAAKWVGEYLLHHPHDDDCPCFRVVRRTGDVGLYPDRNVLRKIQRLMADGVIVSGNPAGRIDLARFRFREFESERPLAALAAQQLGITERVRNEPLKTLPDIVAGVDVSYSRGSAFATCALVATATGELVDSHTVQRPVTFPYISGYLSFRELPALLAVMESLPSRFPAPEVVFVDGNGVLHHRGAGIATHFGVLADLRTIGVGKKLLCGQVDLDGLMPAASRAVIHEGRVIGTAVKSESGSRPIFVSTGQRTTLPDAVRLTHLLFRGHRLPEPLYHADRLSRQAAEAG